MAGQPAVRPPEFFQTYAHGADRPLGGYMVAMSVWLGGFASFVGLMKARRKPFPRVSLFDIGLLTGATFYLARLLAKDAVTSFLRAPFTLYKEPGAPGEVNEEPRKDTEMHHVIGELISCPFCLGTWVAAGLIYAYAFFPRFTRFLAAMFSIMGLSEFLEAGYGLATKKAESA